MTPHGLTVGSELKELTLRTQNAMVMKSQYNLTSVAKYKIRIADGIAYYAIGTIDGGSNQVAAYTLVDRNQETFLAVDEFPPPGVEINFSLLQQIGTVYNGL